MKRFLTIITVLALAIGCVSSAMAEGAIDFSGYSLDELLVIRNELSEKIAKRPGFPDLTYCEVYEEPRKFYVAVHDNDTQILDNAEA